MLHSDWFSLITLVSANVSFSDMMQGDNGNIKVLLGIAAFTDYIAIYLIYHCIVVFCPYNEMALYNIPFGFKTFALLACISRMFYYNDVTMVKNK